MRAVVKVRKGGNSLAITLTKDLVDDLKWKEGDEILLESEPTNPGSIFSGPKQLKAGKLN